MSIRIAIPENLQRYCGGRCVVEAGGRTVEEVLRMIVDEFPKLGPRLLDARGQLQHHLVVIHRDEILRRDGLGRARVSDGEELRLTAAVSGGS